MVHLVISPDHKTERQTRKRRSTENFLSSDPTVRQVCLDTTRRYAVLLTTDGVTAILDDSSIVSRAANLFWVS